MKRREERKQKYRITYTIKNDGCEYCSEGVTTKTDFREILSLFDFLFCFPLRNTKDIYIDIDIYMYVTQHTSTSRHVICFIVYKFTHSPLIFLIFIADADATSIRADDDANTNTDVSLLFDSSSFNFN